MGVYDSFIALADRLISEKGGAATLNVPGGSPSSFAVKVVQVQYAPDRTQGRQVVPFNVEKGDEIFYLAAAGLTVTPREGLDSVTLADGTEWGIVSSSLISPNGERILFQLHVRRWPTRF